MIQVADPDALDFGDAVISIGNFDGVHWGHRQLLGRMRELAAADGSPSVVVTFFPPSKVVFGDQPFLSSAEEKLELLSPFAPTAVAMIPFSHDYAQTDKSVFLAQLARLRPAAIIVGEDFRFGHKRQGTLNDLSLVAGKLEVFGLERVDGEVVKSSAIRRLLADGDVTHATRLLGEAYLAIGTVAKGDQRGRTIGFPTANLVVPERKAMPRGVFSVTVETGGGTYGGMANSGPRPSFPDAAPACEVHLFDFAGDLYDQELRVRFIGRIRAQERFASLDELRARLAEDARVARTQLAGS
ncbi:MAG: riboflavin biosynthesis protein RibF [Trueperaceae bacterium]